MQILLDHLYDLHGVMQDPRYHPEGCALYHSLQTFELARNETDDPTLWAAALFHDVGKAHDGATHDVIGAELLDGLLCNRAVWLVRYHLELLRNPGRARRRWRGTTELRDLERLRRWDLGGRRTNITVPTPEDAIAALLGHHHAQDIFIAE
jgi:hypothetical protein